ncbi:MAG TPA: hypothetical protein VEI02_12925 [Planctomycetota bacterium]|nr:hypothetical protein [Planctomycetota bacterium]
MTGRIDLALGGDGVRRRAVRESATRVASHDDAETAENIRRRTCRSVAFFAQRPDLVGRRLRELDREWDVERCLETGSSVLTLLGLTGAVLRGRRWLLLPLAVQSFFLQHALQGWCPPLPLLRRLGVRTQQEIDRERYALKALRGDFEGASRRGGARAAAALDATDE